MRMKPGGVSHRTDYVKGQQTKAGMIGGRDESLSFE